MKFKIVLTILTCLLNFLLFLPGFAMAKPCFEMDIRLVEPTQGIISEAKALVNVESKLMALPKGIVLKWLQSPSSFLEMETGQQGLRELELFSQDSEAIVVTFQEVDPNIARILKSNKNLACQVGNIRLSNPTKKKENRAIIDTLVEELQSQTLMDSQDLSIAKRYLFFANSYLDTGNCSDAIFEYENAIKYWPNSFEAWKGLAKCYQKLEKYDELKKALERCFNINPFEKELYFIYAAFQIKIQDFEALRNLLMKAFFIYPNDPNVLYHLGISMYLSGDSKGAERFYKRLLALDKEKAKNLYDLLH